MATPSTISIGASPRIAVDHVGTGPLVVFLHGIGGNRTNWSAQLPVFGERFHAVAWDARGYGESDDYDGPLDFADFADDLRRVLDHFGCARAHLVGLSMGGVIALDFQARYGQRVASLTLCDSMPGFSSFSETERAEFIRLREAPLLAGKTPREIAPIVARTLISERPRPGVFDTLVASVSALRKESYLKTLAGSVGYTRTFRLEDIDVPVHLVVGDEDRLTPPAVSRRMAERIRGSRLTIIAGAGHLSNIEQPDAFNRAALDFLESTKGEAHARRDP